MKPTREPLLRPEAFPVDHRLAALSAVVEIFINDATVALSVDTLVARLHLRASERADVERVLQELERTGRIRRTRAGLLVPAVAKVVRPPSLIRRLEVALRAYARAMHANELLEILDVPASKAKSAKALLSKLVKEGTIARLELGVYKAKRTSVARPIILSHELSRVVHEADHALSTDDIMRALRLGPERRQVVRGNLSRLIEDGELQRVGRGIFAPAERSMEPPPRRSKVRASTASPRA